MPIIKQLCMPVSFILLQRGLGCFHADGFSGSGFRLPPLDFPSSRAGSGIHFIVFAQLVLRGWLGSRKSACSCSFTIQWIGTLAP